MRMCIALRCGGSDAGGEVNEEVRGRRTERGETAMAVMKYTKRSFQAPSPTKSESRGSWRGSRMNG